MSPARSRSKSRTLLPYVCTIRSRSSWMAFSAPTAPVSSSSSSALIIGAGTGSSSSDKGAVGLVFTSRSMALITNGRKAGLSSWWNATPSTPQPHHFMCLTSGILLFSFDPKAGEALSLVGAIGGGVVDESAHLFGDALGKLGDGLAVLGAHRFPECHIHRRPPSARPILAVRHGLRRADDRHGEARHIPADAERRSAWLERGHLPGPRPGALGKEQ